MYVPLTCCALKNDDPNMPEPENVELCQKDAADGKFTKYINHKVSRGRAVIVSDLIQIYSCSCLLGGSDFLECKYWVGGSLYGVG